MTRGGRTRDRDGPERRCIATGVSGPTGRLVRFVLGPDGSIVPDLAGKLPGRGVWLTADRALAERAVRKRLFGRAFRQAVAVDPDLADGLERLLAERLVAQIALARKAGQAVTGWEKVRARVLSGTAGVLLTASDAARDGREKAEKLAREVPRITILDASELGLAFGREFAIHAALDAGGIADRALTEAGRLAGFRQAAATDVRLRQGGEPSDGMDDGETGTVFGQGD